MTVFAFKESEMGRIIEFMEENIRKHWKELLVFGLFCGVIFFISFKIVILHMMIKGTDYYVHAIRAIDIFQNGFIGLITNFSYPIWYIGVKFFERVVHLNLFNSAAMMTAIVYTLTYGIIYYFYKVYLKNCSGVICACLAMVTMVIQPISHEGLVCSTEMGRAVFNTWHNPTNIVARFFGIIAFFYFHKILDDDKKEGSVHKKDYYIFSVVMCLANLGKPSFSQVFLPMIVIYCVIYCLKSKFVKFRLCLNIAFAVVPSVLILLSEFLTSFYENGEGIEIAWFEVMNYSGTSNPAVLLGTLMLPIYITLIYFKDIVKDKKMVSAWLMYGIAFLEYAAFAEKGSRRYHGNFGWGYIIAIFILHMVSIIKFMTLTGKEKWKSICGWIILSLHFICGCTYLYCHLKVIGFWY